MHIQSTKFWIYAASIQLAVGRYLVGNGYYCSDGENEFTGHSLPDLLACVRGEYPSAIGSWPDGSSEYTAYDADDNVIGTVMATDLGSAVHHACEQFGDEHVARVDEEEL